MVFEWVKKGGYFRRECRFENGVWLLVCPESGGWYWAVNKGPSMSNPFKNGEPLAANMKEAKQKAEAEYLRLFPI
jgi:hypothetical protein